jgi:hypothetical protein
MRSSPSDTATAILGVGTSRRLPLRAYCYQVVIVTWCGTPSHYMGGPGYKSLTPILLVSIHT